MSYYDEEKQVTLTSDFAYDEVERRLGEQTIDDSLDATLECQRNIWQWVWCPPCRDLDGLFCRAAVACWVFVPQLRAYSMTEMAGRVGKKKQSLGRWVADFKIHFPEVAKHLQHLRNSHDDKQSPSQDKRT